MGKKRKASGPPEPAEAPPQSSKLLINSYEDVADSEDEFHLERDKVLLDEGPDAKRRRKIAEQDEFFEPSEDEVFAGLESDLSDEDDFSDSAEADENEDDDGLDDDLDLLEDHNHRRDAEAELEEEGWGPSKRDYYNADVIETEQDALDEEAEARRLQKIQLESMTEADFGLDDVEIEDNDGGVALNGATVANRGSDTVTEVLPQLQIPEDMGPKERLEILKKRYPEFEPLTRELSEVSKVYEELGRTTDASNPVALVKLKAVSAYLGAIAMYLALLSSPSTEHTCLPMSPMELRDHPVMDHLARCRQLWTRVKNIRVFAPRKQTASIPVQDTTEPEPMAVSDITSNGVSHVPDTRTAPPSRKQAKRQQRAEAALLAAEEARAERLRKTEESFASLPKIPSSRTTKPQRQQIPARSNGHAADGDSDFGETATIDPDVVAEKARKRRSLRFYTSQLAQKEMRQDRRGQNYGMGGDTDIPHRERFRDRQTRLNEDAERRGKKKLEKEEALGGDSGDEDEVDVSAAQEIGGSQEDYYAQVTQAHKAKQAAKKNMSAAPGNGRYRLEKVGADGKRAVGYTIDKNKGLAPKRKKENSNPRVKKKMQYDKKMKKLATMKPMFKGGEGKGGYRGELSGINTRVTKAVKL